MDPLKHPCIRAKSKIFTTHTRLFWPIVNHHFILKKKTLLTIIRDNLQLVHQPQEAFFLFLFPFLPTGRLFIKAAFFRLLFLTFAEV
jgi:hypothetical protein